MHLLILSSEFPPGPGGIGTHAYQVARHLVPFGWDVVVMSPQEYMTDAEIVAFKREQPFEICRLAGSESRFKFASRTCRILRQLARRRPDAILATGKRAVWMAASVGSVANIPVVAVGHGTEFTSTVSWDRSISQWAYGSCTTAVLVSYFAKHLMESLGVRPKHCVVIPNGAESSTFRPIASSRAADYRRKQGWEDADLLLTVGRVCERKGQDVVIRALPFIVEKKPNTHYVMAGLSERIGPLQALAAGLGVAERVHFVGRVPESELVLLQNAADVFMMTSRRTEDGDVEGYGIAAVEAALCELPAVVTTGSGLTEAVVDGETGIAVAPDDPVATASAVLALLEDRARLKCMGEAARRRALGEQTWEIRSRRYDQVLRAGVQLGSRFRVAGSK